MSPKVFSYVIYYTPCCKYEVCGYATVSSSLIRLESENCSFPCPDNLCTQPALTTCCDQKTKFCVMGFVTIFYRLHD